LPELVDFYRVDDLLNEEERLVRSTIGRFVDERFLPIVAEHYERATFPTEIVPELARLGVFGMHLKGYGAAGMSNVMYGLACQELERGDSGLRSFVSVQGSLCMFPIHRYGSEEQKERWLPRMAKGEVIGCFGLTEPEFGSNPAGMATRARRDGDDWIINGTKRWITNGNVADLAIVWARSEQGIRGFLVEKGTNADFGARPLRRAIEQNVEDPLSEDILRGAFKGKDLIKITVKSEDEKNKHLFFEAVASGQGEEAKQLAKASSDAT